MDTTETFNNKVKVAVTIIGIDKLIPFENHPFQVYEGERLEKLANSINELGLQNPIIVRPSSDSQDMYEILSGHNRVEAVKLLGLNNINAIINDTLSDEMAERIVIESNLNQQSFSDWKYSQQIKVIRIYNKYLQEHSQQGRRTDLESNDPSCGHSGHKSKPPAKRPKSRDKISKQLGISASVFERYRSIAKLDDEMVNAVCKLLDEKRIGFMAAYRISQLKVEEIEVILEILNNYSELKLTGAKAKSMYDLSVSSNQGLSEKSILSIMNGDEF